MTFLLFLSCTFFLVVELFFLSFLYTFSCFRYNNACYWKDSCYCNLCCRSSCCDESNRTRSKCKLPCSNSVSAKGAKHKYNPILRRRYFCPLSFNQCKQNEDNYLRTCKQDGKGISVNMGTHDTNDASSLNFTEYACLCKVSIICRNCIYRI